MTADEIFRSLEKEGVEVSAVGTGIKVRTHHGPLTNEQKRLITDNKAALLARLGAQEPLVAANAVPEECTEEVYQEYVYPGGEVLKLTREEFDRVVDVFRMLVEQDTLLREREVIKLSLREKEIFEPDRTAPQGENLVE